MDPRKKLTEAAKTAQEKKVRADAINNLLKSVEAKMSKNDVKVTLGDYIKLLQLSKELTDEAATDLTVTWIESSNEET